MCSVEAQNDLLGTKDPEGNVFKQFLQKKSFYNGLLWNVHWSVCSSLPLTQFKSTEMSIIIIIVIILILDPFLHLYIFHYSSHRNCANICAFKRLLSNVGDCFNSVILSMYMDFHPGNSAKICRINNNYSPKWRWVVVVIYRTAKQWGKYPRLATDTEVNNCFSIY